MADTTLAQRGIFSQQHIERLVQVDTYMTFFLAEQEVAQRMLKQAIKSYHEWLKQEGL